MGQLEDFVNSKFFVCLYFDFASFLQGLLLDERDLEEAEDDDVITPAKIRDKTDHFVHLAKYFVIIQWSGRHVKGRAKKKMIGRNDAQIGKSLAPAARFGLISYPASSSLEFSKHPLDTHQLYVSSRQHLKTHYLRVQYIGNRFGVPARIL